MEGQIIKAQVEFDLPGINGKPYRSVYQSMSRRVVVNLSRWPQPWLERFGVWAKTATLLRDCAGFAPIVVAATGQSRGMRKLRRLATSGALCDLKPSAHRRKPETRYARRPRRPRPSGPARQRPELLEALTH